MNIDLLVLFLNSFFIFGLHYSLGEPSINDQNILTCKPAILSFIPYGIYKHFNINKTLLKPVFLCPICMSSIWGTAFYWYNNSITNESIIVWPVYLVVLAGLTRLLKSFT